MKALAGVLARISFPALLLLAVSPTQVLSMDIARVEARVDSAVTFYGVTGKGVLIAVMDRGIDWQNADFRLSNGKTRIAGMFDLTDDSGALAINNPYGVGTLYRRGQIDSANAGTGPTIPERDAVGHGTTTAGIACGNGRNSTLAKYRGVATDADLLVIKITSDGAPAHDSIPAEAAFYDPSRIPTAIAYATDMASALGEPCVMVLNIGSIGGATDGSTALDRTIDATIGSGIPGLVFVNGVGDDGSMNNHAGGALAGGADVALHFHKGSTGTLVFDLWYDGDKTFDIGMVTPLNTYGPYISPVTNDDYETQLAPDFTYYHYGANVTPTGTTDGKREVYIQFTGDPGDYSVQLFNTTPLENAFFNATINPSNINPPYDTNQFTNNVVAGNIGDLASCFNTVIPTDYNVRTAWTDIDGFARTLTTEGLVGDIWKGSSLGPTFDGRLGVDVALPANSVFTTYAPKSYWATFRFNEIQDGGGFYGRASAVSAANPFLAGIVALMLQKNKNLDAAQVRDMLRASARTDSHTGVVPNTTWGYGKVNAVGAMKLVLATTAVPVISGSGRLALAPAGANPFRGTAAFDLTLPREGNVQLAIMDIEGRVVARLLDGVQSAGTRRVYWHAGRANAGVYFARASAGGETVTRRVVLVP
jgi:minor extracellular serine protease Vpr